MLPVMDYENVFNFLLKGRYPVGFSKDQKRSFRRKACGNYAPVIVTWVPPPLGPMSGLVRDLTPLIGLWLFR